MLCRFSSRQPKPPLLFMLKRDTSIYSKHHKKQTRDNKTMNDPAAPQAVPTVSTDRDKELADAALREAGVLASPSSEQPPIDVNSSVNESESSAPSATESVENTNSSNDAYAPPQPEETATPVNPVVVSPEASSVVAEIPVNDSTSVAPDTTVTPAASEPAEETSASDTPAPQVETPSAPTLEAQSAPATESPAPAEQTPAQPEGLVAKFLHIFKK